MATVWDLWLRRTKFAVAGPTSDRHGRSAEFALFGHLATAL